jgi:hypothetical protein
VNLGTNSIAYTTPSDAGIDERRPPITFDELWRLNFARENRSLSSDFTPAAVSSLRTVSVQNSDELPLTAEDRIFLIQVGIKP